MAQGGMSEVGEVGLPTGLKLRDTRHRRSVCVVWRDMCAPGLYMMLAIGAAWLGL